MSIKAMNWVWTLEELSAQETLVLLALADQANDQGYCYPSQVTLAQKSRCSVRTVKRAVKALEEWGLLRSEARSNSAGRLSNIYYLNIGEQVNKDFSLKNNQRDNLALRVNDEKAEPVDNPSFPYGNNQRDNLALRVPKVTPEVTQSATSGTLLPYIQTLNEPNLSFPKKLSAHEKFSSKEREGDFPENFAEGSVEVSGLGSLSQSPEPPQSRQSDANPRSDVEVGLGAESCLESRLGVSAGAVEAVAPPGVCETPPARPSKSTAGGVREEFGNLPAKTSHEGLSEQKSIITVSPRVSGKSPSGVVNGIDWDILARALPTWMFEVLNTDVARQATVLIRDALSKAWSVEDLRKNLEANPKPSVMSSPAGLVLSRVKRVCAQPAPSLVKPSDGLTGGSKGGFRDVEQELGALRSFMAATGECESLPRLKCSVASVDEVLDAVKRIDFYYKATGEGIIKRLLNIRTLLAVEETRSVISRSIMRTAGGDVR